ncbi:MAG: polyprenyl synthetase family protein [Anaerolineae bacterium]|nr:polyprenyl synthetase family protein [Anaerolineae bacterium]
MTTQDRFTLIRPDLDRLEAKLRDVSDVTYPPLATVITQLVSAGGKRLRPAVALLVNQMYPADAERALSLAAAVEMLHTASLVHDDFIDEAALRRGHPTVNAVWSPIATVRAGDYMFGRAASYVAETENPEVVRLFADTLQVIVAGELRQLFNRAETLPTRDDYYARIYGKTAALFALAAQAAAALGDAPAESVGRLRDYGYHFGMAFQVMDDILDFTADEKTLGKPVGGDLREGIVTLPVLIYAEQTPDAPALRRLWEYRADGVNRLAAADEVVAAVRDSAAIEAARAEARAMAARAEAALAALPAAPARDILADLAATAVSRQD